jgi:hypothetical protein
VRTPWEARSHADQHWSAAVDQGTGDPSGSFRRVEAQAQDRVKPNEGNGDESNSRWRKLELPYRNGLRLAHDSVDKRPTQATSTRDHSQPVWSRCVAAILLTVWCRALRPGSRERGGRTIPQKCGNRRKLSMISDCTVCPSDSRFRPLTKDLGRLREISSFALSRRQRGSNPVGNTRSIHV